MQMNFSKEQVVQAYHLLSHGATPQVKKQADDYLNEFLVSQQAWALSRELIAGAHAADLKFVGVYVLYKKVCIDYASLTSAEKSQIVQFLASLVQAVAGDEQRFLASMVVRAYAAVGLLQLVHGDERQVLNEVFAQVREKSQPQVRPLLLGLLNALAEELQSLVLERRKVLLATDVFKESRAGVAELLVAVLEEPRQPAQLVELALAVVASWTGLKVQLLACPRLVQALLAHYGQPDWFEPVNAIFIQMLETSSFARCFESKTLRSALEDLAQTEQALLRLRAGGFERLDALDDEELSHLSTQLLLEYLLSLVGPRLEQEAGSKQGLISRGFADVFVQLLVSFPVFLFQPELETCKLVYRYLFLLLGHADNSVSCYSLEVWLSLKTVVKEQKTQLSPQLAEFFLAVFDQLFLQLLDRCKVTTNREFSLLSQNPLLGKSCDVDADQDEADPDLDKENKFKRTTLQALRFRAQDVFYGIFEVYQAVCPQSHIQRYLKTVFSFFDEAAVRAAAGPADEQALKSLYIVRFESALFSLRILIDHLYYERESIAEIRHMFGICLRFADLSELPNAFIVKSVLYFMHDFAAECRESLELAVQVFKFCFQHLQTSELQAQAAEVFYVVSNALKLPMPLEVFEQLLQQVFLSLDSAASLGVVESLVTGLFNITKNYQSAEELLRSRRHCFELVSLRLQKYLAGSPGPQQPPDKPRLFAVLKVLQSCFSSLDASREAGENQRLISGFLEATLPVVLRLFEETHELPTATGQFAALFRSVITCCPLSVFNFAEPLVASVFTALRRNPYRYSELLLVFEKLAVLNRGDKFMNQYICGNGAHFCALFAGFLDGAWQDSDFLVHFAKLFATILAFAGPELFRLKDFAALSQKLVRVFGEFNSYEVRRDILKLWAQELEADQFVLEPLTRPLLPAYFELAVRAVENCSSSALLMYVADLVSSLLHKGGPNRLALLGLSKNDLGRWLTAGLAAISLKPLKPEQVCVVVESVLASPNMKAIKKDLTSLNLYLVGEESLQVFTEMQLRVKTALNLQ